MGQEWETDSYDHVFSFEDGRIEVSTHYANSINEPRIRWHVIDTNASGTWGDLLLPEDHASSFLLPYQSPTVATPQLTLSRFGNREVTIFDQSRKSLSLPHWVAQELREELVYLGQLNDGPAVSEDPSVFPDQIADTTISEAAIWTQLTWDPDTKVMWYEMDTPPEDAADWSVEYERERSTSPRAYQIENGDLIWRKHSYLDIAPPDDSIPASTT